MAVSGARCQFPAAFALVPVLLFASYTIFVPPFDAELSEIGAGLREYLNCYPISYLAR